MQYANPRAMFSEHARLFDANPLAKRHKPLTSVDVLVLADELGLQVIQVSPKGGFFVCRPGESSEGLPVFVTADMAVSVYLDALDLPVTGPQVKETYFVSDWLARVLLRQGEIVEHLESNPGWYAWGRCCADNTPYLDLAIENAFSTLPCAVA